MSLASDLRAMIKREAAGIADLKRVLDLSERRLIRLRAMLGRELIKTGACCEYHMTGGHQAAACGDDNHGDNCES
jgi:hypothetical protein